MIKLSGLAKVGAKVRLAEVEEVLKPLLKEQAELQAILTMSQAIRPTRANGKWRMTKKRRESLTRMWEGRRRQAAAVREARQVAIVMEAPLPAEPPPGEGLL
jgi:hypothetical protein